MAVSHQHVDNGLLRTSLERVQTRFCEGASRYGCLAALLVHSSQLGRRPEPAEPVLYETQGYTRLNVRGGPWMDPRQLTHESEIRAFGKEAVLDAKGRPIVSSSGEPIAISLGSRRTYSVFVRKKAKANERTYSDSCNEYMQISSVTGELLGSLGNDISRMIWRDWPHGYVSWDSADLWTNAVFEVAFQRVPGAGLSCQRWVWGHGVRLMYEDVTRYRESESESPEPFTDLANHVGFPPSYWYAWIPDIWHASVAAIDVLRMWLLRETPSIVASKLSNDSRSAIDAILIYVESHKCAEIQSQTLIDLVTAAGNSPRNAIIELEGLGIISRSSHPQSSATAYHFDAEYVQEIAANLLALRGDSGTDATPKKKWTRQEAESVVAKYLRKNPDAGRNEVHRETGISAGTVSNTDAWKNRRRGATANKKPRRARYSNVEQVGSGKKHEVLDELIESQQQDAEASPLDENGDHPRVSADI